VHPPLFSYFRFFFHHPPLPLCLEFVYSLTKFLIFINENVANVTTIMTMIILLTAILFTFTAVRMLASLVSMYPFALPATFAISAIMLSDWGPLVTTRSRGSSHHRLMQL